MDAREKHSLVAFLFVLRLGIECAWTRKSNLQPRHVPLTGN